MASGGYRPGGGRPPSTSSIREAGRLESGVLRTLPRERTGAVPTWPLTKASARELTVWRRLWKRPQAIVWAEQGSEDQVAIYVRTFCEAETDGASAAVRALLLRQENALLLTHSAFLSAGLRITAHTGSAMVAASTPAAARRQIPSSRGRLRAVPDDATD